MPRLEEPVQSIKGIGPKTSLLMNKINIFSIEDLLIYYPRAYEDRRLNKAANELIIGETVAVFGVVSLIDSGKYTDNGKHITRVTLKCGNTSVIGVWFNQRYIKNNFLIGKKYLFYGRISIAFGEMQIINPEYEKEEGDNENRILPIYKTINNLSRKTIRNIIFELINSQKIKFDEAIPEHIMKKIGICSLNSAIKNIHFPDNMPMLEEAKKRIKFEELLILEAGLILEKNKIIKNSGISFKPSQELKSFFSSLSFELTKAQKKAVNEIINDMKSNRQMNRLVQGDVGSGKTLIAVAALFNAVKNGYQGAMLVPTEVLASQHYDSFLEYFCKYGIKVELLSSKVPQKEKIIIKEKLKLGVINILIGTHAVIQDDVEFNKLGIVVTDEQHRFGVRQRALFNKKGKNPDILVMTATPIPRTMALFVYGDMDISVIDELPPGRQKIETYAVGSAAAFRVYKFVKNEIDRGRQAYVVCPIIDESDFYDIESVTETYNKLKNYYLKNVRIELLHGKMKSEEKDSIMMNFRKGKIDIIVSTTVIEVGINVPNATVMVIENADRFGLAQLHQLRGRVGRGQYKSYCILISEMKSLESKRRMKVMQEITDGFKIAEKDMEFRGTGEFFGTKQHGLPELIMADIIKDSALLKVANELAKELILSGDIYKNEFEVLRKKIERNFNDKESSVFN